MSDRDELERVLRQYDMVVGGRAQYAAGALWSAGWRKKPSREAVKSVLAEMGVDTEADDNDVFHGVVADAILALLDGLTETGEK